MINVHVHRKLRDPHFSALFGLETNKRWNVVNARGHRKKNHIDVDDGDGNIRTMKQTLNTRDIKDIKERKKENELFRINKFIWNEEQHSHTDTYAHIPNKKVVILLNPNREQIKWWRTSGEEEEVAQSTNVNRKNKNRIDKSASHIGSSRTQTHARTHCMRPRLLPFL